MDGPGVGVPVAVVSEQAGLAPASGVSCCGVSCCGARCSVGSCLGLLNRTCLQSPALGRGSALTEEPEWVPATDCPSAMAVCLPRCSPAGNCPRAPSWFRAEASCSKPASTQH